MTSFFCSQGGHCGDVQPYLKIPWKSKIIMYIIYYMKLCSIFNCFFPFSGWREEQRFVLKRVGADLQVFMSVSNNRGTADIKDIMATGKRSQVARLVCEPSLVILSSVTYRILEKRFSSGRMLLTQGRKSFTYMAGLWVRFQVGGYKISWRGISLRKQPFLLAPHRFWHFERRNLWD